MELTTDDNCLNNLFHCIRRAATDMFWDSSLATESFYYPNQTYSEYLWLSMYSKIPGEEFNAELQAEAIVAKQDAMDDWAENNPHMLRSEIEEIFESIEKKISKTLYNVQKLPHLFDFDVAKRTANYVANDRTIMEYFVIPDHRMPEERDRQDAKNDAQEQALQLEFAQLVASQLGISEEDAHAKLEAANKNKDPETDMLRGKEKDCITNYATAYLRRMMGDPTLNAFDIGEDLKAAEDDIHKQCANPGASIVVIDKIRSAVDARLKELSIPIIPARTIK